MIGYNHCCKTNGKCVCPKQPAQRQAGMLPELAAPYTPGAVIPASDVYTAIKAEQESILQEAHRLTHGPRRADYGHPLDDYSRTAALGSALLAHKLKEPITAAEMALLMCCVKLSRQIHVPKRDNMTDLAGYAWVAQECLDEAERRKVSVQSQGVSESP